MNDEAEIYLDLTGAPLYKRGYRLATSRRPCVRHWPPAW